MLLTRISNRKKVFYMTKKKHTLLLSELTEQWLENLKPSVKLSTYSTYSFYFRHYLKPYSDYVPVNMLNQTKVLDLLTQIQQDGRIQESHPLSANSMRLIYFILKSSVRYGVSIGELELFPFPTLKGNRNPDQRLVFFHKKEQERLEEYILEHFSSMSVGILISLYTGLRIGELCALTWDQINLEEGFLTVNKTIQRIYLQDKGDAHATKVIISEPKTRNAQRDIPLSNQLIQILNRLMPCQTDDVNFLTHEKGKYCEPRTYRNFFKRVLEECGLPQITFHACRHTFASRCVEIGIDVKTISKLLGHSNVNLTLNRYVHSNLELQRKEMERLGNLMAI